jgi:HD-GYP domain-containing protein (c-di-GMP phosphodiesterase class II)
MLDKMLVDGELCIRLLSSQSGDRMTAHALNVTVVSMLMGRTLGLPEAELLDVGTGALLHDIGKLDLPTARALSGRQASAAPRSRPTATT